MSKYYVNLAVDEFMTIAWPVGDKIDVKRTRIGKTDWLDEYTWVCQRRMPTPKCSSQIGFGQKMKVSRDVEIRYHRSKLGEHLAMIEVHSTNPGVTVNGMDLI